ncbi:MAG: hypothetical protein J6M30_07035 [Bacteroidales bacterium]|nr:hypothetical protein [Bacteroidales bacterium]
MKKLTCVKMNTEMIKRFAIVLSLAVLPMFVKTAYAQSSEWRLQDRVELYAGLTDGYSAGFDFDKAKDLKNSLMFTIGGRYKAFDEWICFQSEYSIGILQDDDFASKTVLSSSIDMQLFEKEKYYCSLGVKWQDEYTRFSYDEGAFVNQYCIKVHSLGPYLRYKNKAWNVQAGYLFGLNKHRWQSVADIQDLPKDRTNQFFVQLSVNIPIFH